MTAISHQASAFAQGERAQLTRTFSMTLAGAGCWALAAGVACFLVYVIMVYAPGLGDEGFVADVLPIFASIVAILGALGTLAVVWRGARRRAWFWLVPVVLAILLLVQNAQDIPYDLARPAIAPPFLITIVVLAGAWAAIAGGVVAFLEVRRGQPLWARSGRAGWLSTAVIGIVVGAALTSLLASRSSAYGAAVGDVPTTTEVVTIEYARFVENSLHMKRDEVLGLFIVNLTDIGHSFDVDNLDIHVLLVPNSTTAVTIQPTGPGTVPFYCSVHGHRAAGMAGTITIE